MTHFDHVASYVPDLIHRRILDIGSGRGSFLVDAAARGAQVVGIELNAQYRTQAQTLAAERGVSIEQHAGVAEELPFVEGAFDFINMGELIEHVESPETALREAYRVLRAGGVGYISAPNRFGFKDQHYHLFGINWMPRAWADRVIVWLGKDKGGDKSAGHQRLSEMHYYRWSTAVRQAQAAGFEVEDIRELKLRKRAGMYAPLLLPAYYLLRTVYFDSFHLLVRKLR